MTRLLAAEYNSSEGFLRALETIRERGLAPEDVIVPFRMEELDELLPQSLPPLRPIMAAAGFGVALFAFALQSYSAMVAYPINSGGRPTFSWPVFLLAPFEVGVLAAAIAGFITFLVGCRLPRLHHPLFELAGVERAAQDRFFILMPRGDGDEEEEATRRLLFASGALSIEAGET